MTDTDQANTVTRQDLEACHDTLTPATSRAVRYVYHLNGHAKLHGAGPDAHENQAVPFEVVLRFPEAIASDEDMERVRADVRGHVVEEMNKTGTPYIVGSVMIRGVSFLHRILVDAEDVNGPPARVMP
mgnify:CR=1 FL=1